MCGIFGYVGKQQNAGDIVFEGLKRLDYRGYDSWGVGVEHDGKLIIEKYVGKISDVKVLSISKSSSAIAHTRWATTGAVTQSNAHPHMSSDTSFMLAQNGIVENFEELKHDLVKKGHIFVSETDTEVIVRLIEIELQHTRDYVKAIRSVFLKLTGRNTIIVLTNTGEIYAARNGSPLVVGINSEKGDIYLSSDTLSFANSANKMIVIENNQLVSVDTSGNLNIFDIKSGKKCDYTVEDITINVGKIDRNGFDHFMLKEIYETPTVIRQIINTDEHKIQDLAIAIRNARQVYTIGSGTAGFAASQIAFYLRVYGKINACSLVGADTRSYDNLLSKDDLIIAPSQSGETADVIEVLEYAHKKNIKIASIVNMPGSMMSRMSDFPFMANAGPEICVMSTKVFVSQIAWGYLVAKAAEGKLSEGKNNLKQLATSVHNYLDNSYNYEHIKKIAQKLSGKQNIFLLGKYQNLAIINEGMVKIIEATYKHAHAIPAGDLKHYAITLIEKGVPVIAVISDDIVKNDIMTAINEVRLRGAEVIAIAHENHENFDTLIETPDTKETDAIGNVIPLQLLAYYMAVTLGNNVDKPRNIAKSVTVK